MEEDEIRTEIVTLINDINDITMLIYINQYLNALKNIKEQA